MSNSKNTAPKMKNNNGKEEVAMPQSAKAYTSYLKDAKGNYILNKDGQLIPTSMIFVHNGKRYVTMLLEQNKKYMDKKTGEVKTTSYYDVHIYDAKEESATEDNAL